MNTSKRRGLPMPQMVAEAIEQSKSRPLAVELILFVVVYLVGGLGLQSLLAIVGLLATSFIGGGSESLELAVMLYSTLGLTVTVMAYCRIIERRKLATMGFRKKGYAREYMIGFAVGTLMIAATVGICYVAGAVTYLGISPVVPWGILLLMLGGYLLQGMSEEVLFRGYFMVSMARRQHVAVAIFISSAFFSLLHFANPNTSYLAFANLFLFGVFEAVYFYKRGDIWGTAAIHSAWNYVQGNIFGISVSGLSSQATLFNFAPVAGQSLLSGGAFGLEGGLAATAVLVVLTAIMLALPSRNAASGTVARQKSS